MLLLNQSGIMSVVPLVELVPFELVELVELELVEFDLESVVFVVELVVFEVEAAAVMFA